jgi:all-trans-retinol dehydrogenase (NAD+)
MIKNKRGHIVAIASIAGISPGIRAVTYSASKCGVRGLMHALQDEIELEGYDQFIHTSTVYPWFINTRQELVDNVTSRVP